MRDRRLIVVLGMHRSGTSALTKGLETIGVDLGCEFHPICRDNPKGYWEDRSFHDLNEELLHALGHPWDDLGLIEEQSLLKLCEHGLFPRAIDLVQRFTADSPRTGVKDPRFSLLLPFWKKVFAEAGVDVSYVLGFRDPRSVAESLAKRDGMPKTAALWLWLLHNVSAVCGLSEEFYSIVDYDLLIDDPRGQLTRLGQSLGLEVQPAVLDSFSSGFLDASLRHHRFSPEADGTSRELDRKVSALCGALKRAAGGESGTAPIFDEAQRGWQWMHEPAGPLALCADLLASRRDLQEILPETHQSFAVCTIVATNYLARALVLHDSLKAQHPEADFWLLLIDDLPLGPLATEAVRRRGLHLLRVQEIGLEAAEIANFRFAYDLTEVATAYKPWLLETLLSRTAGHLFYIDPDIEFFAPMTSLVDAVNRHELVLTPHVLEPMRRDGCQPDEEMIKGSGIYNLGFLGVNRNATRVLTWWKERLKRECYSEVEDQLFTDQRWMDFAPALFDCCISKDETFNVAYWNVDQRPVRIENGRYFVRQNPLTFFHFSGFSVNAPYLLTRHDSGRPRILLSEHPVLQELVEAYAESVAKTQAECADTVGDYQYNRYSSGELIAPAIRRLFLKELVRAEAEGRPPLPSPFSPEGEEPFFAWLSEPQLLSGGRPPIPRLVLLLREMRRDLILGFPDAAGADAVRLVDWFRGDGARQFSLPPGLIPEPLVDASKAPPCLRPGMEIVGYLQTESGLGQAARLLTQAAKHSNVPFRTMVHRATSSRQEAGFADVQQALNENEGYDRCVLCVNADALEATRWLLGANFFEGRRVAGVWFWEVETFPSSLHYAFGGVHELWVATEFIRSILAPISPVPVRRLPLPIGAVEPAGLLPREELGIPDGFFFLFNFDFHSVFRRKNPLGVVEAFKQAFAKGEGPALVIKGINGGAHLQQLEELRYAAKDRGDIIILADYLDPSVNRALTAACDCYVSLHRSEGLGLTMAEAMGYGKPVIATGYSGNMDFMNQQNSFLCGFEMVPVGEGSPPYEPETLWAEPDLDHAAEFMRWVYTHPEESAEIGRIAALDLTERFGPDACAAALEELWAGLGAERAGHPSPVLPIPSIR